MNKLKKIGILFIFLVMLLPISNVFANEISSVLPNDYQNGLLDDVELIKSNTLPTSLYDNDILTGESISSGLIEFNYPVNISSIYFNGYRSVNFKIQFYNGSSTLIETSTIFNGSYTDLSTKNLNDVISISFLVTEEGFTSNMKEVEFFGSYDLFIDSDGDGIPDNEDEFPDDPTNTPPDNDAPSNVTNIKTVVTSESIKLTYDLPLDEDFSHLLIYRDSELVGENVILNSYVDSPLLPDTHYVYNIKSVDKSGNISSGTVLGVRTGLENDTIAPDVPTGLKIIVHNSALSINWNSVDVLDLAGYNVFVNGVKHNSSLIQGTSYNLYNLENGVSYDIQVSAVDTSGNESDLSSIVSNSPSFDAMPIFKMGYSLEDVSNSVSTWFSEFWLILAFATSIPLAFIIANRVKSLFIA